jgi:hypothetical protein
MRLVAILANTTMLLCLGVRPGPAEDMLKECDKCPEMIVVPAGSFTMGSRESEKERSFDEGPQPALARPRASTSRPCGVWPSRHGFRTADASRILEGGSGLYGSVGPREGVG